MILLQIITKLFTECSDGRYGVDCSQTCRHCSNNSVCDNKTGSCLPYDTGFNPPLSKSKAMIIFIESVCSFVIFTHQITSHLHIKTEICTHTHARARSHLQVCSLYSNALNCYTVSSLIFFYFTVTVMIPCRKRCTGQIM